MRQLPSFDNIRSFLTLAEELSYRRTAERLNLDQSALSRRIQKLEGELGFRLFERTTRDVHLTQAGRRFYEENADVMLRYKRAISSARLVAEGKTGTLRVAYMAFAATELMPRAVARFQQAHPHVDVRLRYIRTRGQKIALANDEIDIGYMIGPLDHPDYHTLTLLSEPLYLVAANDHPLLQHRKVKPAMLAAEQIILGDKQEWEEYRWRLDDMFSDEGIDLRIALEASNTLALIGLVAAGLGVTICPQSLIGFLGCNVDCRLIDHPAFQSETLLVWKRKNRSQQVRSFVDLVKEGLKANHAPRAAPA